MAFDDVDYLSVENESGPRQLKYVAVVNKLTEHCTPKSNETYERFIFRNRVLMEGESVEIFITDLRKLSKSCNFGDLTNSLIKDQLVYGINDSKIQQRLLETSNLDLNKALEIINAIKVSRMQSSSLPHFSGTGQTSINSIKSETKIKAVTPNDEKLRKNCRFCGMTHKVRQCPAYGKKCDKCQKINHFAKVCKSVNVIDKESDSDSENSSDTFSLIGEIIKKRNANDWHIKSIIRNKEINFKLDTGAQCNVLPLHLIKTMKGVKIRNRAPKLISYSGNTIKTIGKADLELEYKQKFYIISFIIVQSKFMPVLGLETCLEMNLIKRVNAINAESKYKCLFSGLGCLPGKYKISTDESVPPVVHPPRKFPHTLKHKIKEELDRLEQFGVIHKVTKPTKWVNSMVVIRKTNNKIRLCLDPRDLNKAIKREHFPMKTVEEVAANLKNAKVFTTLDATQGFYQIRLDEESTWLTTFNTPFGKELIIADALSRAHSTEYPESEEFEINMIAEVSDHQASNFRRNSQEDVILSRVMSYVTFGWPEKSDELPNELKDYFNISDELNICDGILLKGDRLVVPDVMKGEMLRRIHSSHLGIEKCIARARTCLFWINMPKDIKTKVENCHICQRHRNYQQKETLIQEEIPDRPWQKLATDVFYYSNHKYLVVADYYSKFFEMSKIPDVTSHTVIDRLKSHFACHGIPEILKSDNGPEYSSFEFKTFVNKYNIKHITSSPRYPQSNGFAERTVQTAKNLLKKAKEDKQDVEISLLELRNTPLKDLGLSPAEILMGRKTRSWLPIKKSLLNPTQDFHMSITDNFRQSQQQQKHYYDKTSKNLQKIHKNEHVRMRDGKQWIPAKCIETEDNVGPRSYLLQCKGATFRRNRKDILQTKEHFNESDICDKPPNIETSFKEVSNFNNSEHHSNQDEMDNGDVSDHIKIKDEGDVSDHINIKDEGDIIVSKDLVYRLNEESHQLSPAESRNLNRPCLILDFYDDHDIWHFLSSSALFFSFMILLTLDDDLIYTPRDKIPVF
ncbi:hypothetical protein GQR58_017176 [Nymphon striatum]|nr:hypothetical protein GQR58_017176 [Nymphon striatum]